MADNESMASHAAGFLEDAAAISTHAVVAAAELVGAAEASVTSTALDAGGTVFGTASPDSPGGAVSEGLHRAAAGFGAAGSVLVHDAGTHLSNAWHHLTGSGTHHTDHAIFQKAKPNPHP